MPSLFRLENSWIANPAPAGTMTIEVFNLSDETLTDFSLCYTSITRIVGEPQITNGHFVLHDGSFNEIAAPKGFTLKPGGTWMVSVAPLNRSPFHVNDGAKTAYLKCADGRLIHIETGELALSGQNLPLPGPRLPEGRLTLPFALLPWPVKFEAEAGSTPIALHPAEGTDLAGLRALSLVESLHARLFPQARQVFSLKPVEGGRAVSIKTDTGIKKSGFTIDFTADLITVTSADADGTRHGLVALAHILDGAKQDAERFKFPASGRIEDAPRHDWRGCLLDVSRHFWTHDEVTRFLDIMAWYRLNTFHWHLTDDEAWRIEIPELPELTGIGATRAPNSAMLPQLGDTTEPSHGFYTQAQIRSVVEHAQSLGIEVVPEVDMPGHCKAVLTALPYLQDRNEANESYKTVQGFTNNALNPAMPATWEFVKTILDNIVALFPGRYIHIGGDEVADNSWIGSPLARELMEREGLEGTFELQSWFMRKLKIMLEQRGRVLAGWNEVAHGGGVQPEGTLLMAWQAPEIGIELAKQGYDVVMTPGQAYYLDMAQSHNWWEPGAGWAGASTPEESYAYEAAGDFPPELAQHLKGVQACIWCEHFTTHAYFNDLTFPRLLAVAEAAWTPASEKDWLRFAVQARRHPLF